VAHSRRRVEEAARSPRQAVALAVVGASGCSRHPVEVVGAASGCSPLPAGVAAVVAGRVVGQEEGAAVEKGAHRPRRAAVEKGAHRPGWAAVEHPTFSSSLRGFDCWWRTYLETADDPGFHRKRIGVREYNAYAAEHQPQ